MVFTDQGEHLHYPLEIPKFTAGPRAQSLNRTALRVTVRAPRLPVFTVNLDHFKLLRVVGKGAFGKVRIVERKDTGLTFALKYIRKDEGLLQPS